MIGLSCRFPIETNGAEQGGDKKEVRRGQGGDKKEARRGQSEDKKEAMREQGEDKKEERRGQGGDKKGAMIWRLGGSMQSLFA